MTQLALCGELPERGSVLPRCTWRGCLEPAAWSLGFGRDDAWRLYRVEGCRRAQSVNTVPADAHAREALEAEPSSILLSV